MGSVVRNFVWCLNDVDLSSGHFYTQSPTFFVADSGCEFCLQFGYSDASDQVSVSLCRSEGDSGPPEVTVRFLLSLEWLGSDGGREDTYRSACDFARGRSDGFYVGSPRARGAFQGDGSFVVRCDTFNPSPTFRHASAHTDVLSGDLLRLLETGDFANARLVASDGDIVPVHREILSVRSPVFEREFETGDVSALETPFPTSVVRAVLTFVYSGDISKIDFLGAPFEQVLQCAEHYGVSGLTDLLTPSVAYFATKVDRRFESHPLQFDSHSRPSSSPSLAEHRPIRMRFDKRVEMAATLLLEPFLRSGTVVVEILLRNLTKVRSVGVRMLILLDGFVADPWRQMEGSGTLEPDAEGRATGRFEYRRLSARDSSVFPGYSLRLQCEMNFKLSGDFSVSDPGFCEGSAGGYEAHRLEISRAYVRSLERLMETASLSDACLYTESNELVPVHKSVLAARSPAFRSALEAGGQLTLPFPAQVSMALLRYVYTGNLVAARSDEICHLHHAAKTYGMDHLRTACSGVVSTASLDIKSVYSVYLIAAREGDLAMLQTCKEFVLENKDIILGSFRWENFRSNHRGESMDIMEYIAENRDLGRMKVTG